MIEMICLIAGFLIGFLMFFKHDAMKNEIGTKNPGDKIKISVIIPARNESANIANLLNDLKKQDRQVDEIICIDDESEDSTAQIARLSGARVIPVINKPQEWTGKSWACQCGADAAAGDVFIFMDADVRIAPSAVGKLENTYIQKRTVISVQPFHYVNKIYEQASFFFNLTLIAANGVGFPLPVRNIGLFGPVILIDKDDYRNIGGHNCAKSSVIEDLVLGEELNRKKIPSTLFWGDMDFSFKMYRGGFKDLFQGWSKNFASGAAKTPFWLLGFIILWFYSCTGVVILLAQALFSKNMDGLFLYLSFYIAWVIEFMVISRKIGSFNKVAIIFYPVILIVYLVFFAISIIKRAFSICTVWKGRKLKILN